MLLFDTCTGFHVNKIQIFSPKSTFDIIEIFKNG